MPRIRALTRRRALIASLVVIPVGALAVACGGGSGDDSVADQPGPALAIQDDRIPVARPEELEPRLDMLADTGAENARVDFFWSDIAKTPPADPTDPDDPAYDWTRTDTYIQGLTDRGITPLVSVYNTPQWAARNKQGPPEGTIINNNFPEPQAFGEFMEAVATRYSGEFTPAGSSTPLPAVNHIEVWNEPNFRSFLGPQIDSEGTLLAADAYAQMAEVAYPAIKRGNPDAVVIAGVGGPRGTSGEGATGARQWLRALRARDIPMDAYSQHIYPASAPDVETIAFPSWSSIDGFLEELDQWKPGVDLYITEAGYTTMDTPFRKVSVTEDQQAEYMKEIFQLPQVNQERVAAIVWFNMQDNEYWPAGILRLDATEKPSYPVFQDLAAQREGKTLPALATEQTQEASGSTTAP